MGTQENIFANSEGDAWFERNVFKLGENPLDDPVIRMIASHGLLGRATVEFGCSNGWRLAAIQNLQPGAYYGFDPSASAIANGQAKFKNITLGRGTVVGHPLFTASMGLVIYGFCLYVCDPEDHFEIAAQGNNILSHDGNIIIHDFDPEHPHCVPNKHVPGLMTYKRDWSQLWLHDPAYTLIAKQVIGDGTAVWLLKKDLKGAYPEC